jgi:hypothetical protein
MAAATLGGKERPQCPACGFVAWRNPAPVGMRRNSDDRSEIVAVTISSIRFSNSFGSNSNGRSPDIPAS